MTKFPASKARTQGWSQQTSVRDDWRNGVSSWKCTGGRKTRSDGRRFLFLIFLMLFLRPPFRTIDTLIVHWIRSELVCFVVVDRFSTKLRLIRYPCQFNTTPDKTRTFLQSFLGFFHPTHVKSVKRNLKLLKDLNTVVELLLVPWLGNLLSFDFLLSWGVSDELGEKRLLNSSNLASTDFTKISEAAASDWSTIDWMKRLLKNCRGHTRSIQGKTLRERQRPRFSHWSENTYKQKRKRNDREWLAY